MKKEVSFLAANKLIQEHLQRVVNKNARSAIEVLEQAVEDGAVIDFDMAIKAIKAICRGTEPNIGAGAMYDWTPLEDELSNMVSAQSSFDESCRAADETHDYAWESDAASINKENSRSTV